jgi:hypothetical protein
MRGFVIFTIIVTSLIMLTSASYITLMNRRRHRRS